MKFMEIDIDGFPTAFYAEDVHGARVINGKPNPNTKIPADAVQITDEQWQELISNQGTRRWDNNKIVAYEPPPVVIDTDALDQDTINKALVAEGSIVRALGLVMFEEINKLRTRASLPVYSLAQFQAALMAKIRDR